MAFPRKHPALSQFNDRNALSDPVKQALSRGVCLLGRKCLQGNHLIQVPENIVADKQDGEDDFGWCAFLCRALAK